MMRYGLIALLLAFVMPASAVERNLEKLYRQIDDAISHSPEYVAAYENKIKEAKDAYAREWSSEKRLGQILQIFDLYKAYNNDSALSYIQQYINQAEKLGHTQLAYQGKVRQAFQCSTVGLYTESIGILRSLDSHQLDKETLPDYYMACMHVCGELSYYTRLPSAHDEYEQMRNEYRDSLFMTANPASENYLRSYEVMLTEERKFEDALKVNDQRMKLVKENSREYAIVSYYRYIIYQQLNKLSEAKYWLAQSALSDVRYAVMDQAALLSLAEILNGEGQLERSYKYIRFTWESNNRFNTRMRSWQISPILNACGVCVLFSLSRGYEPTDTTPSSVCIIASAQGITVIALPYSLATRILSEMISALTIGRIASWIRTRSSALKCFSSSITPFLILS